MKPLARRRPRWALLSVALFALGATAALPTGGPERAPVRRAASATAETEARVIVKYRADSALMRALSASGKAPAPPQNAQAMSARLGITLVDGRAIGAQAQALRASGITSRELAARLAAQPEVEFAEVDGRMHALAAPNDPLYAAQPSASLAVGQWYLRAPSSAGIVDATSTVSAINAEAAWNVTTGSANVVVAVLDTGVRRDHPDLTSKLLAGYDFISTTPVSNDGDGRDADPADPGDFDSTDSSSWHGTQTAGLVGAATNNGVGMASVGRDVMVLPVRVLGTGGGFDSDIQAAMLWAGGLSSVPNVNPNPAKVINLSLGAKGVCNAAYLDVVRQLSVAGVVVVAAAGNDGLAVGTPANCQGVSGGVAYGVIAVAGVRHAGTKVGYSDLGPEIAIAAPAGNCVNATGNCLYPLLTTSNSGASAPVSHAAGGSIYTGVGADASLGTSFAAPLVSGTVGLMFAANPSMTPAQALAALKASARAFPASGSSVGVATCVAPSATAQNSECYCTTSTCGAGLLDAGAAVNGVAANLAVANVVASSTQVVAADTIGLSGALSRASATGAAVQTYAWSIAAGSSIASFTTATNASTAALKTSAPGSVVVALTITDSAGKSATTKTTLAVVAPTTAAFVATPGGVTVGTPVALDASTSSAANGRIVSYQWTLGAGTSIANFTGATNAATAALATTGVGNVTVNLQVTDEAGKTSTTSQTLTVSAVPSSSGGGALGLGGLLAWLLAVCCAWAVTPNGSRPRAD
jgi:serine protease